MTRSASAREHRVVEALESASADLMAAAPDAFREKFRRMAHDPYAFLRGSAALFYRDLSDQSDRWAKGDAARVWIHGDLHCQNFGTYLDDRGRLLFDVNDFDEAYVGPFTWDLRRFTTSLSLLAWQKALPDETADALVSGYLHGYLDQVDAYRQGTSRDFSLRLGTTDGPIHDALVTARRASRLDLLDSLTVVEGAERRFADSVRAPRLRAPERRQVLAAYAEYLRTIPGDKRSDREVAYEVREVVAASAHGIGSAGLREYLLLVEGHSEALDNDVVLSMKQAARPAVSHHLEDPVVEDHFVNQGQRTMLSQRALQAHTDPYLGWTTIDGVGHVVSEVSPYEVGLDWESLVDPREIADVVRTLGRATAKIHCSSDADSSAGLVDVQVEEAVHEAIGDRRDDFVAQLVERARRDAARCRRDHALFVDAFRAGRIGGLDPT